VRPLFAKFLVGFWVVLAVMIAAETILETESLNRGLALQPARATGPIAFYAELARDALASDGRHGLDALRVRLRDACGVASCAVDSAGTPDVLARDVPDGIRAVGLAALGSRTGVLREDRAGFFSAYPIGSDGERALALVMWPRGEGEPAGARTGLGAFLPRDLILRAIAMVILGGLASFLLARSITAPIVRLRHATDRLARGDLAARFGARPGGSRDEIELLGGDFDRMAARIETLVTAQRRLLGDISHELRSPLARMAVALGLLRQEASGAGEMVDRLELEIARLDRLIEDILALSRSEAGEPAPASGQVDLDALLNDVAADARFEAAARDAGVVCDARSGTFLHAIRTLLRSAFENVIRNAIEHTAAGTTVEIVAVAHAAEREIVVTVRDPVPGSLPTGWSGCSNPSIAWTLRASGARAAPGSAWRSRGMRSRATAARSTRRTPGAGA